jgi:hypothetical protein
LIIYVKVEEAQFISDVSASHVATGILGFANKGATGIRLRRVLLVALGFPLPGTDISQTDTKIQY